jgi:tetratricopeptide (TPR) repeat protein
MKYFCLLAILLFISCYNQNAQYYYEKGNEAFISEDYDVSINNLDKAILLKPNFAAAYFTRANSYLNLKNFDKALENYTSAIGCNPRYAIAYRFRGVIRIKNGDTIGAINDWQTGLRYGDNRSAHYLHSYKRQILDDK